MKVQSILTFSMFSPRFFVKIGVPLDERHIKWIGIVKICYFLFKKLNFVYFCIFSLYIGDLKIRSSRYEIA